jgi:hypothetical protein
MAPNKSKRNNSPSSNSHSRRQFLIRGLVAALGVFGGLGITFLAKKDYGKWYNSNFLQAEGEEFAHSSFLEEYEPNEQQKAFLENELNKKAKNRVLILESKFNRDRKLIALAAPESAITAYAQRSRESIRDFFAYIGEQKIPNTSFHVLSAQTSFLAPDKNNIPMYLVWKAFDVLKGSYLVEIRGKRGKGEVVLKETAAGESVSAFEMHFGNEGATLKQEKMSAPVLTLGFGAVATYTSPPAEALHYALRGIRIKSTIEEINKKWLAAGKPSKLEVAILNSTLEECLEREEGLVHGLLDQFTEEKSQQLGFSAEAVYNYQKHNGSKYYSLTPRIREILKSRKASEVLQMYKENPLILFANQ